MHYVYRMFDSTGRLLYIGETNDISRRFGEHEADKPEMFGQMARFTVDLALSKAHAEMTEREAIKAEQPIHNVVHNGRPVRQEADQPEMLAEVEVLVDEPDDQDDPPDDKEASQLEYWRYVRAGLEYWRLVRAGEIEAPLDYIRKPAR